MADDIAPIMTADLCDAHEDKLRVLAPVFRDYGGRLAFHGRVVTIRSIEDNLLIRQRIERPGQANGEPLVLVVDGGESLRRAITGGNIAATAAANGWAGLVIAGAVRDLHELKVAAIGIKALGLCPIRPLKAGAGDVNVPLLVGGQAVNPGDYLYADGDGIVVATDRLH